MRADRAAGRGRQEGMDRVNRQMLTAGALLAAAGVALGAFGAHGLRSVLDERALGWWQTAVQYQMWHGIGLLVLSALPLPRPTRSAAAIAVGTIIFSGTLYGMALTNLRWLGAVTPIGGTLMILGWLLLAFEARK